MQLTIDDVICIWFFGWIFSVMFFSFMCSYTKQSFDMEMIFFILWPLPLSVFVLCFLISMAKKAGYKLYILLNNDATM